VVVHKDESVQVHGAQVQVVRQLREEALPVLISVEDIGPAVAAAGDMIDGVGKINAWRTWHA